MTVCGAAMLTAQTDFAGTDRNGDGTISRDEWTGNARSFRNQDTNRDGVLSGNELPRGWRDFSRGTEPQRRAQFTRWDANDDDNIQRREWRGDAGTFRQLDANRDGVVSWYEYSGTDGEGTRARRDDRGYGERDANSEPERQRFRAWDKNGDGIIQSTEWQTEPALFHRLDTNGNSQVEWDEFRAQTGRSSDRRR
jgi:hypothetical protein